MRHPNLGVHKTGSRPLADITYLEVQYFDNTRNSTKAAGIADHFLKVGCTSCTADLIYRTHPQLNQCPIMDPVRFRKALTKRVTEKRLTEDEAAVFRQVSREVPPNTLLGLVRETNQLCTMKRDEDDVPVSVTIHLEGGPIILRDGIERGEKAQSTASAMRWRHDPHGWYSEHKAAVRAAFDRRLRPSPPEAAPVASSVSDDIADVLATLAGEIGALKAAMAQKDEQIDALIELAGQQNEVADRQAAKLDAMAAHIERLEARLATHSVMEADRPLTVEERTERARRQTDRMKADRAAASASMVAEMAAQHETWMEGRA